MPSFAPAFPAYGKQDETRAALQPKKHAYATRNHGGGQSSNRGSNRGGTRGSHRGSQRRGVPGQVGMSIEMEGV